MYENHRDNFGRRGYRTDDNDRQRSSWRDRGWSDQSWAGDSPGRDDDRTDWRAERGGYRSRSDNDAQGRNDWQYDDHDRDTRHFRATSDYQGDNRQTSYFNAEQNSWAVPPVRTYGGGYAGAGYSGGAGGGYGRDYLGRDRGYDRSYGREDYDRNERGFLARAGDEVASWFGDEEAARRREADHRGRGPKDYVRSDERIRDDVNDRLTEDWRVDASDITVRVEKGEVTLDGTVTAREAKRRAEDLAEDVSGVKHVQNNLRVAQTAASTGGAYDDNWALNQRSTAEGGTLGKDATTAKH